MVRKIWIAGFSSFFFFLTDLRQIINDSLHSGEVNSHLMESIE